jgi:hypothetical protein
VTCSHEGGGDAERASREPLTPREYHRLLPPSTGHAIHEHMLARSLSRAPRSHVSSVSHGDEGAAEVGDPAALRASPTRRSTLISGLTPLMRP